MGIFDKLISEGAKALKEVATEENKEKAASFLNELKGNLENVAGELKEQLKDVDLEGLKQSLKTGADTARAEAKQEYFEEDGRDCKEKILEVLAKEFPQYTVREDVSPSELGGEGKFMNYSLVVSEGEVPKLVMMLIGKTTTAHREYRWAREIAEKKGIPFLNFVVHYPNTVPYITERLRKYL